MKRIINRIDHILFYGYFKKKYLQNLDVKVARQFDNLFGHKLVTYYDKKYSDELSALCDLYGSDKGSTREISTSYSWPPHTYTDYYSRLFEPTRDKILKVFECGIGTNDPNFLSSMGIYGKPGASLRVWRDYFPNAQIIGVDIDHDTLFEEDRINTFWIDQLDAKSIINFWEKLNLSNFDVMIDDGLHTFDAGYSLFVNSIKYLAKNGIYIIEDVGLNDLILYKEFFDENNYFVDYVNLVRPNSKLEDNSLIIIRKT